ncbi:MAG: helix-turn-helix transcriptional regulator [Oscillospiraceae bacterium]|nr:helix-turn-helix transcriptional regulator [Oscillospiraceae bacterium]
MDKRCISQECLQTTGFNYTLSLINGKYKMTILYTLMEFGVVRFNEMKRYIGDISYKTLSSTLKELETDQLINRKEYPQIPPKVEYSLTERGKSLIPILDGMCEWGDHHRI